MPRERWDSRSAFVLGAIGSAVGLGNLWRFPYVCFKHGGGAFLIPYLVALFTTGIPLMMLEFSLGHRMQGSAPLSFSKIKKGFEWVGWLGLLIGFSICTYYAVVMAWCFVYTYFSFGLKWGSATQDFFFKDFLHITGGPFQIGKLQFSIIVGLILSWTWIIQSVWKGIKTVGKVVLVTVPLPWIILIIFVWRGITLPGAFEGLKYYFTPNFKALFDLKTWFAAYGQVFFSLTLGFGVMIAYASFLPEKPKLVSSAFFISIADTLTAFVGGIAVFSTLGYLAHTTGKQVPDVVKGGVELAFVTYPTIINLLPFFQKFFGFLFFVMLLTLAIDSAFSLVEGLAVGIMDKWSIRRNKINISVGIFTLLGGLIYTTQGGLYWLDIVDYFMSNFGLILVGFLECVLITFGLGTSHLREWMNQDVGMKAGKWWDICIVFITPLVLLLLIISNLLERIKTPYGNYPRLAEFIGGWFLLGILVILSIFIANRKA